MLATLLTFAATVLAGLARAWLSENDVVNSGVLKQQLADTEQANAQLAEAIQARDSVKPLDAASVLQHNQSNDADFRD